MIIIDYLTRKQKKKMSENDYCVYARNILTRLDAIGNPTTGFTSDIVRETGNSSGGS